MSQKKYLGAGVGLRPAYYSIFHKLKPKSVQWLEVISENYMPHFPGEQTWALQNLESIRRDYPIALHGVSMNLGSVDEMDPHYLYRLKLLIERVNPIRVTDHLAWSGVQSMDTHDLLPVPYTKRNLLHMVEKIQFTQDFLGTQIGIENPSAYVAFKDSEIPEWEFLNELVERSGCFLLLDLNNVFVSGKNLGIDVKSYINRINSEAVKQIHLAGHSELGTHCIDTHDQAVAEPVWQLFVEYIREHGLIDAMIERDDNIPSWEELESEVVQMAAVLQSKISSEEEAICVQA